MKRSYFAIATLMASTVLTQPAMAQNTESDRAGADSANNDNIIIVTATRRAQDVQDIPVAVTAVSPVQLERQGVVNVSQITSVSPSFSTSNAQVASGSVVLRIRGVGTTSNNIGFESAVGIFIDGAYQSRPGIALSEFVDVERVEVLRGPQGTLFGRNTSAGALNITNVRPDLSEFGGFVNASYGNYDLMSVQGAVNVPLVQDQLAARVTGAYRKRDGFLDIIGPDGSPLGESNELDQYLLRGQLGYESDSGITARLIFDYSKSTGNCCGAIELLASPVETLGLFQAVGLDARGGMAQTLPATNPNDVSSGQAALERQTATASILPMASADQWGVLGEIKVPLSDSADLIYIGSYREFSSVESYDSDFSGLDVFDADDWRTNIETMTHELRIQGELFDGRLNWLVGGYYSEEDIAQSITFSLGEDYGELAGALLFGPTGGTLGANPLTLFSGVDPAGTVNTNNYTQSSKSWSIFTHNTLEVADGLELTLGLRYSDESKDGSFFNTNTANSICPASLAAIGAGAVPGPLVETIFGLGCFAFTAPADLPEAAVFPLPRSFAEVFSDEELIYTGKIAYSFDFPLNVYASFTHGYKSGGFNLDSTAAAGGADPRFLSEEVDAYEAGAKFKTYNGDLTVNLAIFLEKFTNFQVLEFTGAQFTTFNVPKAETQGVELEFTARPSENFVLNGGLTYTDANYPDDCAGTQTSNNVLALCGNSLTNAPKWVGIMGATYSDEIGDDLKFFLNGQVRTESDRRTSTQAFDPADLAARTPVPFDIQNGNVKINLRAGIGSIDDQWGLELWAVNLTNEQTRGVSFNTVLRSGSRSAFPQEPRTYGVTLRGKF